MRADLGTTRNTACAIALLAAGSFGSAALADVIATDELVHEAPGGRAFWLEELRDLPEPDRGYKASVRIEQAGRRDRRVAYVVVCKPQVRDRRPAVTQIAVADRQEVFPAAAEPAGERSIFYHRLWNAVCAGPLDRNTPSGA